MQTKWHDLSDRRGYDYARENIKLREVGKSKKEALELIDNIEARESATPVSIEFEAATTHYEQWLDDQTEAFIGQCGAPTQSVEEARLKQETIRNSDIANGCHVEPEWFEALLASLG